MARTAYVFIYLPRQIRPVVAGRFDLQDMVSPQLGQFVYAQSYLSNPEALPLDPIALPLKAELFTTTLSSGFFGVFRDAIPDDWGRHVASRLHGDSFQTDFDYLFLGAADRIGALAFGRTAEAPAEEAELLHWDTLQKSDLLSAIQKIDRDAPLNPAEEHAAIALGADTSAGGARPKITVRLDDDVWLAKLNRHNDRWNVVRVEAAMLDLAGRCGISVPEHRLERMQRQDVLLVKRFDRALAKAGILRHRMVSAATVFQADEAMARLAYTGSYPRLSRELARWTVSGEQDRHQLFRRIAFNSLCSITDDHERNHALVAEAAQFRLSPAFDLVPQPGNTRKRLLALNVGEYGAIAVRENLLSSADSFLLSQAQANTIIDEVRDTIGRHWRKCCQVRGVQAKDILRVQSCFAPDSFEDTPRQVN
ncbi:MAG: type toxin-antitoxin system HipA family toxin [Gammaproteobacteria bacterium]|jgi:serine/threonine-protein kinase HipA|nr:type toxin-antitoxin system HipA family toxin [Gammaproteobacteria bacterium]